MSQTNEYQSVNASTLASKVAALGVHQTRNMITVKLKSIKTHQYTQSSSLASQNVVTYLTSLEQIKVTQRKE